MYLLDTNIISQLAPDRQSLSSEARLWLQAQGEARNLFLSAMTVAEIERGLRKLHRLGGIERARRLAAWLDMMTERFGDRVLPIDSIVARIAGVLQDDADSRGRNPGLADVLIAATAKAYGLKVVTLNIRHFEMLDVDVDLPDCFRGEPS